MACEMIGVLAGVWEGGRNRQRCPAGEWLRQRPGAYCTAQAVALKVLCLCATAS